MSAGHTPDGRDTPDVPGPWVEFWDWMRGRLAAVGHGALFFLLTLPEIGLLLLILALMLPGPGLFAYGLGGHHNAKSTALALALPALVVSLFLISGLLLVIRRLASLTRRLAGQWCGVPIADPYLPPPAADGEGRLACAERLRWLLTDPATWRDLLWVTVNLLRGLGPGRRCPPRSSRGPASAFIGPELVQPSRRPPSPATRGHCSSCWAAVSSAGVRRLRWLLRGYGLLRQLDAGAGRAGRAGAAGPASWPRPAPRPSTPGPPKSAGSSGTCTTERRPGWSPWA